MDADSRSGVYRFSKGNTVFYVEAHPEADIDEIDYGFPPAILNIVLSTPQLPDCNWADIRKDNRVEWKKKTLKGVSDVWHPVTIDLRDVEPVKYLRHRVWQVRYRGLLCIAKIARFEFEVPWLERETVVYGIIDGQDIGPPVVGHLMEEGRVMGLLIEYIPNTRPARPADLETCATLLRKLHNLNILHTDINIYNFLINENGDGLLCDFEDCRLNVGRAELEQEEQALITSLHNDIGQADEDGSDIGQHRLKCQKAGQYRI